MAWKAVHPDTTTEVRLPEWLYPTHAMVCEDCAEDDPICDVGAKLWDMPKPQEGDQAVFTIGFWPPRIAEKLNQLQAKLREPDTQLDPVADQDAYLKSVGLTYDLTEEMVAYGVRGWSNIEINGETVTAAQEMVEIDGRKHPCLTQDAIHFLSANRWLGALATKCWLYNVLTEDEKKTFGLRLNSPSSKSDTDAADVTQSGKGPIQGVA